VNTSGVLEMSRLQEACVKAALAGMQVLRPYQTGAAVLGSPVLKQDSSLLTVADGDSEEAILGVLTQLEPGIPVLAEESGLVGIDTSLADYTGDLVFLVDPADGTFPLALGGSTTTVAVSVYSRFKQEVVAAAIGCPATGRLYFSNEGKTFVRRYDTADWELKTQQLCRTWQGEPSSRMGIWLDVSHSFTRQDYLTGKQRPVLDEAQVGRLMEGLRRHGRMQMYGSNADHQRLVASGAEYAGACITTAVGGPWDLPGILLAVNAGGAAAGFRLETDHEGHQRLTKVDFLDALRCDLVVTAHSSKTVVLLADVLRGCIG